MAMRNSQKREINSNKEVISQNLNLDQEIKKTLVISCVFGVGFSKLWPAKKSFRCVLFSNNPELEIEAVRKGWEFTLVDFLGISTDPVVSSLQSKYIKFLQFFEDFPIYQGFQRYVYYDHKNFFSEKELMRILGLLNKDKSIFMISSRRGRTAADELEAACASSRYNQAKEQTVKWVDKQVELEETTWDAQVYATSFIIYQNINYVSSLIDKSYQVMIELNQPQCQTIWAILIKNNMNHLQFIYWNETSMIRKTPLPLKKNIFRLIRRSISFAAGKFFNILGFNYQNFRKKFVTKIIGNGIK